MDKLLEKSLNIKEKSLSRIARERESLWAQEQAIKTDIAALKRSLEIQNELQNTEFVLEDKIKRSDRNADRTKMLVDSLKEKGRALHMKEIGKTLGIATLAARNWYVYQMKNKKNCPWEFGKNKSWIKLRDQESQSLLRSLTS